MAGAEERALHVFIGDAFFLDLRGGEPDAVGHIVEFDARGLLNVNVGTPLQQHLKKLTTWRDFAECRFTCRGFFHLLDTLRRTS
jgi:hypothetical protein